MLNCTYLFDVDLMEMAKEEWIVFRGKSQMKLLKFVDDWSEKLGKTPTTTLTVRLLQELSQYKVSNKPNQSFNYYY